MDWRHITPSHRIIFAKKKNLPVGKSNLERFYYGQIVRNLATEFGKSLDRETQLLNAVKLMRDANINILKLNMMETKIICAHS